MEAIWWRRFPETVHISMGAESCANRFPGLSNDPKAIFRMLPFMCTLAALSLPLVPLVSLMEAAPTYIHKGHLHSNPFSNASWPLPRRVTGQNDTANVNSTTEGWGGIHLHDPSMVMGPDGHYYSFLTHGLTVISRASEKGCVDGYWEILGSVLDAGSSVVDNPGSTDPW